MKTCVAYLAVGSIFLLAGCAERFIDPTETNVGWVDVQQLPEPRSGVGAAVYRDRLYVAGGWDSGFVSTKSVWWFDATNNVWEVAADLPTGMAELSLVTAADTLFAVGGLEATTLHPSRQLWAYDPRADRWMQRRLIPDERHGHAVFAFDGDIFLVGGPMNEASTHGPRVPGDSVLVYDVLTAQWTYRNPMMTPRVGVVGVWNVDRFLVIGGNEMLTGISSSAAIDAYDPTDDAWQRLTEDPRPSFEPAAAAVGGEVHLIGGSGFPTGSSTHRVFNTTSDSWDVRGEIWAPTGAARAVTYRDEIYLIGGRVGRTVINRVMVYKPAS